MLFATKSFLDGCHQQVGAPPELAPAFALDPKLELRLQHHLEEHEVARPHHQDMISMGSSSIILNMIFFFTFRRVRWRIVCHHQVVGVQEEPEVALEG